MALARDLGLRIDELPVSWGDVPGSKIRAGRDSLSMAAELIALSARRAFSMPSLARPQELP
jgi:hypothetical protein